MQIRIINPNTTQATTDKIAAAARQVARPGTTIIAVSPRSGPESVESHFEHAVSVVGICQEILRGQAEGADAFVIACFGDPGLDAARELTSLPVVGIAQSAFQIASLIATRFSIVTTLARTVIMAERLLQHYGYTHLCRRVRAAEVPVLDLEHAPDEACSRIVDEARRAYEEDGVGAIVLGCAGMADLAPRISEAVGIPVVEGVTAAVTLADSLVTLRLGTCKHGDLAFPPAKRFTSEFARRSSQGADSSCFALL